MSVMAEQKQGEGILERSARHQDYLSKHGLQWDPRFPNQNQTK